MVLTTTREPATRARTRRALIDCDFHNELDSIKDLYPYLPERWSKHIETFGLWGPGGGSYPRYLDDRVGTWPPSGRRAGSDPGFVRDTFLEPEGCAYAILTPLGGGAGNTLNVIASWVMASIPDTRSGSMAFFGMNSSRIFMARFSVTLPYWE